MSRLVDQLNNWVTQINAVGDRPTELCRIVNEITDAGRAAIIAEGVR